jgi:hypothetical protein
MGVRPLTATQRPRCTLTGVGGSKPRSTDASCFELKRASHNGPGHDRCPFQRSGPCRLRRCTWAPAGRRPHRHVEPLRSSRPSLRLCSFDLSLTTPSRLLSPPLLVHRLSTNTASCAANAYLPRECYGRQLVHGGVQTRWIPRSSRSRRQAPQWQRRIARGGPASTSRRYRRRSTRLSQFPDAATRGMTVASRWSASPLTCLSIRKRRSTRSRAQRRQYRPWTPRSLGQLEPSAAATMAHPGAPEPRTPTRPSSAAAVGSSLFGYRPRASTDSSSGYRRTVADR